MGRNHDKSSSGVSTNAANPSPSPAKRVKTSVSDSSPSRILADTEPTVDCEVVITDIPNSKSAAVSTNRRRYWESIVGDFSFKCPYHSCDTCSEFYHSGGHQRDARPLFKCIRCPRAFHLNCMPPGTRFNALNLLCPLHPECILPTELGKGQLDRDSAFNSLWDQMTLPEVFPNPNVITDNHFCLPSSYRFQTTSEEPKPFRMLHKLTYDALPEKEKSVPLHIQEEHCDCVDVCDDRCMNRILCIECDDKTCKVRRKDGDCGNRLFSNRFYSKTERIREDGMGFGLKAAENISSGRLVLEYLGEVIDDAQMRSRLENQRINAPSDKDYYVMQLGTTNNENERGSCYELLKLLFLLLLLLLFVIFVVDVVVAVVVQSTICMSMASIWATIPDLSITRAILIVNCKYGW